MDPRFSSAVFLILSCWLWNAECRHYTKILKVPNGGRWGEWGEIAMCSQGYAKGFALKVQPPQGRFKDDSSLTGILLLCPEGELVESYTGEPGIWGETKMCSNGNLMAFALQVEAYQELGDDTAANNIEFTCEDLEVLKGSSTNWGVYGPWSEACNVGAICGIKTKVEAYRTSLSADNTGLNDVQFVCCD